MDISEQVVDEALDILYRAVEDEDDPDEAIRELAVSLSAEILARLMATEDEDEDEAAFKALVKSVRKKLEKLVAR